MLDGWGMVSSGGVGVWEKCPQKMALSSETRVTWRLDDATLACEEILAALDIN
jgi:hypothetical protein